MKISSLGLMLLLLLWPVVAWGAYGEIQPDASDIIALWHLNGVFTDTTGNYNGTETGGTIDFVYGVFGLCGDFEESDSEYIDVGDITELDNVATFSICVWVNAEGSLDTWGGIFDKPLNTTARTRIQRNSTTTALLIGIYNGSTAYGITPTGFLIQDTWQHICITYDGGETGNENRLKAYLNSNFQVMASWVGTIPATTADTESAIIGLAGTAYFDGLIEEVVIFQSTLTADEIKQIYAMQKGHYGTISYLDQMPPADRIDATARLAWDWERPWGGIKVA